ncbi:MAG: ABC transporter permease [Candidatus Hermodarchaeia archaeon]
MIEITRLAKFLVRRILFSIPVFFGVTIIVWALMYAAGDPVRLMLAGVPYITPEVVENLRRYYHLDRPVWEQYIFWVMNLIQGNLGDSFIYNQPVIELLIPWTVETLKLQLCALALALFLAIFIGVYSARHPYSIADMSVTTLALLGVSMPIFVWGIFGILIFSSYAHTTTTALFGFPIYFPPVGAHAWNYRIFPFPLFLADAIWHMILPMFVLAITYMALYVRLVRSGMRETLEQDYVLAARASGLSDRKVVYKHALRNALIPLITFVGLAIATSFAGAPITETVFTWPGLGYYYVQALYNLDFPLIMAIISILTILILAANIVVDMTYGFVDPRITVG